MSAGVSEKYVMRGVEVAEARVSTFSSNGGVLSVSLNFDQMT